MISIRHTIKYLYSYHIVKCIVLYMYYYSTYMKFSEFYITFHIMNLFAMRLYLSTLICQLKNIKMCVLKQNRCLYNQICIITSISFLYEKYVPPMFYNESSTIILKTKTYCVIGQVLYHFYLYYINLNYILYFSFSFLDYFILCFCIKEQRFFS